MIDLVTHTTAGLVLHSVPIKSLFIKVQSEDD